MFLSRELQTYSTIKVKLLHPLRVWIQLSPGTYSIPRHQLSFSSPNSDPGYLLHPAILDACIQVTAYKPFHGDYDPNIYYLPAHVDVLIVHQRLVQGYFPNHVYAHVELKKWVPGAF